MKAFFNKNKQIFVLIIKILIILGSLYFIYNQLSENQQLDRLKFHKFVYSKLSFQWIIALLLMSFANRFLEILKWQNLVKSFQKITIAEASKQVLAALTAGIFTPNGVGEYAGKALYYSKSQTKNIIFLNFICNGVQMVISILLGLIGLFYLGFYKFGSALLLILLAFIFVFKAFKTVVIKSYSMARLVNKIKAINQKIHRKNILLAFGRYFIFSHQYYLLFIFFDVQLPYFSVMSSIAAVYFLASSLPNFQFFDFAVKGSVGVYFFGLLGIQQWIAVFVATIMWGLNIVLPVLMGGFYVLKFKVKWQ